MGYFNVGNTNIGAELSINDVENKNLTTPSEIITIDNPVPQSSKIIQLETFTYHFYSTYPIDDGYDYGILIVKF